MAQLVLVFTVLGLVFLAQKATVMAFLGDVALEKYIKLITVLLIAALIWNRPGSRRLSPLADASQPLPNADVPLQGARY
jgi:hypothetical protein